MALAGFSFVRVSIGSARCDVIRQSSVALLRRLQRTRLQKFWPRDLLIAIPANRDEGKSSPMRGVHIALWVLPILAGCATTSDSGGGVKEVSPGTYSIGVSRSSSVMFGGTEGVKAAVDEAGKYCHSKGQKLVILPTKGNEVTFQCGEKIKPDTDEHGSAGN